MSDGISDMMYAQQEIEDERQYYLHLKKIIENKKISEEDIEKLREWYPYDRRTFDGQKIKTDLRLLIENNKLAWALLLNKMISVFNNNIIINDEFKKLSPFKGKIIIALKETGYWQSEIRIDTKQFIRSKKINLIERLECNFKKKFGKDEKIVFLVFEG